MTSESLQAELLLVGTRLECCAASMRYLNWAWHSASRTGTHLSQAASSLIEALNPIYSGVPIEGEVSSVLKAVDISRHNASGHRLGDRTGNGHCLP